MHTSDEHTKPTLQELNKAEAGIELNHPFFCTFRVRYSDTDQMGFMHHSCYLSYYENARWELFRCYGCPYDAIEKEGIILPVINAFIEYKKAALYDQLITIGISLKNYRGARFIFDCSMFNESKELINRAEITVACVSKDKGCACLPRGSLKKTIEAIEVPLTNVANIKPDNRRRAKPGTAVFRDS